jgi:uncharacterized protein YfaS (alpha-2-macroglobulin family)
MLLPETLYWNPAAVTDVAGRFAFDLPLPDLSTTWRVTVLASTLDGDIGAATYPIAVVPPCPPNNPEHLLKLFQPVQ